MDTAGSLRRRTPPWVRERETGMWRGRFPYRGRSSPRPVRSFEASCAAIRVTIADSGNRRHRRAGRLRRRLRAAGPLDQAAARDVGIAEVAAGAAAAESPETSAAGALHVAQAVTERRLRRLGLLAPFLDHRLRDLLAAGLHLLLRGDLCIELGRVARLRLEAVGRQACVEGRHARPV